MQKKQQQLYDAKLVAHTNKIFSITQFKLGNDLWKVAGLSPQTNLSCSEIALQKIRGKKLNIFQMPLPAKTFSDTLPFEKVCREILSTVGNMTN